MASQRGGDTLQAGRWTSGAMKGGNIQRLATGANSKMMLSGMASSRAAIALYKPRSPSHCTVNEAGYRQAAAFCCAISASSAFKQQH